MQTFRRLVVRGLIDTCWLLDKIPGVRNMNRRHTFSTVSCFLDQHWETGVWEIVEDNELTYEALEEFWERAPVMFKQVMPELASDPEDSPVTQTEDENE